MRLPQVIAGLVIVLIVGGALVIVLRSPPPASAVGSWGWVPCAVDQDCGEGAICRTHHRPTYGPIRACRPVGPRREGEPCGAPPESIEEACKASLNCNYGLCGRKCSLDSVESCPPGTLCRRKLYPPEIHLRCIRPCKADGDCGTDAGCVEAECIPRCDITAPKCPPDWYCAYRTSLPGTYCHPPL